MSAYQFLPRDAVQAISEWPMVESFLKEALDQEEYSLLSIEDIRRGVHDGRMVLWTIYLGLHLVGAFITQIESGGKGKAVNVVCLGGEDMPLWIRNFSDEMVAYTKLNGGRFVCEMGRKGWVRVLSGAGWIDADSRVMLKMVA